MDVEKKCEQMMHELAAKLVGKSHGELARFAILVACNTGKISEFLENNHELAAASRILKGRNDEMIKLDQLFDEILQKNQ